MANALEEFEFNLYDRTGKLKRPMAGLLELDSTVIHNDAGVTSWALRADNPSTPLLVTPGCRLQINFRGVHLTSGLVHAKKGTTRQGRGAPRAGVRRYSLTDDFVILKNLRAWPNPLGSISQQGDDEAYYSMGTAPAETVLKDVVTKNIVQRLRMAVTVEADQRRGSNVNVQFRNHPLYDRLFPAVEAAGIGVRVRQIEGSRRVEVYTPRTFGFVLDEENGVIRDGDWGLEAPTVSRGVVGGQGQGTARHFETFQDLAREQLWGEIWETSVDARDTDQADAYAQRAAEALLEGAARDNISLNLVEAGRFVFGGAKGLQLGDRMAARIESGAITITDVLREARLTYKRDSGLKVETTIGVKDEPTGPIQAAMVSLAKGLRDVKAGQ